jgi:hypothetical protein
MSTFTISGQIKNKQGNKGVPALTVEAVAHRGKGVFGKTLTARDGSYIIGIDRKDYPELFRTGKLLFIVPFGDWEKNPRL